MVFQEQLNSLITGQMCLRAAFCDLAMFSVISDHPDKCLMNVAGALEPHYKDKLIIVILYLNLWKLQKRKEKTVPPLGMKSYCI